MFFWWICGGESGLPIVFFCHLRNPYYPILKISLFLKIKTKLTIRNVFLGSLRQLFAPCCEFGSLLALSSLWSCFTTLWTVVCQAPLSIGIPWQKYCSGLPFPSPYDLPHLGIKLTSPALQVDSFTTEPPGERLLNHANTPGFLGPRGEEFNPGPETRLDRSELLCNKVLLKYKGDRESFWHRHQKGAERVPAC